MQWQGVDQDNGVTETEVKSVIKEIKWEKRELEWSAILILIGAIVTTKAELQTVALSQKLDYQRRRKDPEVAKWLEGVIIIVLCI